MQPFRLLPSCCKTTARCPSDPKGEDFAGVWYTQDADTLGATPALGGFGVFRSKLGELGELSCRETSTERGEMGKPWAAAACPGAARTVVAVAFLGSSPAPASQDPSVHGPTAGVRGRDGAAFSHGLGKKGSPAPSRCLILPPHKPQR